MRPEPLPDGFSPDIRRFSRLLRAVWHMPDPRARVPTHDPVLRTAWRRSDTRGHWNQEPTHHYQTGSGVDPDEKRKLWYTPSRSLTLSQSCLMA